MFRQCSGMAKVLLAVVVLLFAFSGISVYSSSIRKTQSATGVGLRWVFRNIEEHPQLLSPLIARVPENIRSGLMEDVYATLGNGSASGCAGCKATLGLLQMLARDLGLTYEGVVRDVVIGLCRLMSGVGTAYAKIVCPMLMDGTGPHVAFIVRNMTLTPEEACQRVNLCLQEEFVSVEASLILEASVTPSTRDRKTEKTQGWHEKLIDLLGVSRQGDGNERGTRSRKPSEEGVTPRGYERNEVLTVAHVTDFHIDEKYLQGSPTDCNLPVCCRADSVGKGTAGKWGTAGLCNIPPRTTELFLRYVADLKPDFVLYTGDNPPHSSWEENQRSQLKASRWVAESITRNIYNTTSVFTYPTIGNHEMNPTNMYTMIDDVHRGDIKEFNEVWGQAWSLAAGFDQSQLETINKAGYYTVLAKKDLRILSFNSNYGYVDNYYNLMNFERFEYLEMMEWVRTTLAKARTDKEKVIIVTHHDIGKPLSIIDFDHNMTQLLAQFKDVIVLHVAGHAHADKFHLYFAENSKDAAGIIFIGQTMNTMEHLFPAFRIFFLDKNTGQLLDYNQYYIDLSDANKATGEPVPKKLYSLSELYGMKDASVSSFKDLAQRMLRDDQLIQKYNFYKHYNGQKKHCNDECKIANLCEIISQRYDVYLRCLRTLKLPPLPTDDTPSSAAIVVASSLVSMVLGTSMGVLSHQ